MICILALIVFAILGVFSAKYRVIAKEAFNCVFKKMTFRKCDTGLDTRLKGEITGKLLKFSPKIGRAVYKYFEVFSWILLILTLVTLYFMGLGLYNYAVYGNCNGKDSNAFCIYDPLGTNKPSQTGTEGTTCSVPGMTPNKTLVPPSIADLSRSVYVGNPNAKVVVIEFGCYSCHYTKQVEPTVQKILDRYGDQILYVYKDFPLSLTHATALPASQAAHCALDQGKYWEYREYLFANQNKQLTEDLTGYAKELGLDEAKFNECLVSSKYENLVNYNYNEGIASGISVTPTFFVNNQSLVGAKDYSEFKKAIRDELGIPWWQLWK